MATTAGTELGTDTTLKAKVLSTPEVLAQSVANMAPSAAMALLPLFVFFSAGNALWLSFALGLLVMLMVGYCAAQFGKRINSAGSFYVWVTRALGERQPQGVNRKSTRLNSSHPSISYAVF